MSLIICKRKVGFEQLMGVPTPAGTETFVPIPHSHLVNLTRQAIERVGLSIVEEEHGLASNDQNYFGGFALRGESIDSNDKRVVLGLRNSHAKKMAASICIGASMTVCENLHFSSDIRLGRNHTKFIFNDLPRILADAIGRISSQWNTMNDRFDAYKQVEVSKDLAANLMIDLADARALPPREIYPVIQEFRSPRHPEFKEQNLFSLFNALTQTLKGSDLSKLPFRTMTAESIFDRAARFSPQVKEEIDSSEIDSEMALAN